MNLYDQAPLDLPPEPVGGPIGNPQAVRAPRFTMLDEQPGGSGNPGGGSGPGGHVAAPNSASFFSDFGGSSGRRPTNDGGKAKIEVWGGTGKQSGGVGFRV